MKIRIINGPNLNMLGFRNQDIYGNRTLKDLEELIKSYCLEKNIECDFMQSNHEGVLIDAIHESFFHNYDGIVINPGALGHYSFALRDALEILSCPKIEVHISNIYERETFRKISVISEVCDGTICGKGFEGYIEAIKLISKIRK